MLRPPRLEINLSFEFLGDRARSSLSNERRSARFDVDGGVGRVGVADHRDAITERPTKRTQVSEGRRGPLVLYTGHRPVDAVGVRRRGRLLHYRLRRHPRRRHARRPSQLLAPTSPPPQPRRRRLRLQGSQQAPARHAPTLPDLEVASGRSVGVHRPSRHSHTPAQYIFAYIAILRPIKFLFIENFAPIKAIITCST